MNIVLHTVCGCRREITVLHPTRFVEIPYSTVPRYWAGPDEIFPITHQVRRFELGHHYTEEARWHYYEVLEQPTKVPDELYLDEGI